MKKKGIKLVIFFAAVAAVAAVIAAYFLIPDEIRKITGVEEGQDLYIEEKITPDYEIKPVKFSDRKSQLRFTTSDEEVASVDDKGVIKANKLGETVLTISVMNYTQDITLKVVPRVTDIKGVKKAISLTEGDSWNLGSRVEIVPAEKRFKNEKISYKSDNPKIVSVTKTGILKARKPGNTVITMSGGGYSEKITVTVNEYIPEPEPTVQTQTQSYYSYPSSSNSGSTQNNSNNNKKSSTSQSKRKSTQSNDASGLREQK